MTEGLRIEPEDVYEAGDRLMQVGIRVRNLVERQVANHPIPDLPDSLRGVPAELSGMAARMRPDISEIILVGQRMKDDARDVGEVDVYYDMSLSEKAVLALDENPGVIGDKLSEKLKSDAEWWRQQGVWPAAALLDGTRDLGAGLEGMGVIAGEVAAGNFERPKAIVDAVLDDPVKYFQDAINWKLLKSKPGEWLVRSLPSVAFAFLTGGASTASRVPLPRVPDIPTRMRVPDAPTPHALPGRRPLVTDISTGSATFARTYLDTVTANASVAARTATDAARAALHARAALARQARLRRELGVNLDRLDAQQAHIVRAIKNLEGQQRPFTINAARRLDELTAQMKNTHLDRESLDKLITESWKRTEGIPVPTRAALDALKADLPPLLRDVLQGIVERGADTPAEELDVVKAFLLMMRLALLRQPVQGQGSDNA